MLGSIVIALFMRIQSSIYIRPSTELAPGESEVEGLKRGLNEVRIRIDNLK